MDKLRIGLLAMALLLQGVVVSAADPVITPMTAQQKTEAEADGQELAEQANAQFVEPTIEETGGERDQGTVDVAGERLDINKLIPGADRDLMNTELEDASQGQDKEGLRRVHERNEVRLRDDTTLRGLNQIHDQTARDSTNIRQNIRNEIQLDQVEEAITGAEQGQIGGESAGQCTTTETRETRTITREVIEEQVCERTVARTDQICSRELVVTSVPVWNDANERALLEVGQGVSGEICRRTVTAEEYRPLLSMDKVADLDVSQESGGLVCVRNRWAENVVTPVSREKLAELPINEEIGGLSCTRSRWAETVSGQAPGFKDALLGVNNETGGRMCTRTRVATMVDKTQAGSVGALLGVNTDQNGLVLGGKQHWPTGGTTGVSNSLTAALNINTEVDGLSCSRTVWPTSVTNSTPGTKNGVQLTVNQEQQGQEARRWIRPYASSAGVSGSKNGTLGIDNQAPALICTRTAWPTSGSNSVAGSHAGSLTIDTQSGGQQARRRIVPFNSSTNQGGSKSIAANIDTQSGGLMCTRTAWPTASTSTVAGSHTGTLTIDTQSGGQQARRRIVPFNSSSNQGGSKLITATIDTQSGGLMCTRTAWPTGGTGSNSGSKNAVLSVNTESSRLECRRRIVPATTASTQTGEQNAELPVDTQTSDTQCVRAIGVQNGTGTSGGSMDATLSINNESNVTYANRWRNVTGGSGSSQTLNGATFSVGLGTLYQYVNRTHILTPPGGTSTITNLQWVQTSAQYACNTFAGVVDLPTAANGWTVTYSVYREAPELEVPIDQRCQGSDQGYFRYTANSEGTRTWSVVDQGDVFATGTANCPASWACTTQAPTTINGISVTAAEVSALGALYPGAPSACTYANLRTTCGGTATGSNQVSIAAMLPAGTTTISGFTFTVLNPQSGVSVTRTQTPSAANGWIAIFSVSRTDWSYTPNPPQIRMTWTNNVPQIDSWVWEGVQPCANATATTNCPLQWRCDQSAPSQFNGITIDSTIAARHAPLYPGASSTCTYSSLNRVCSGTANVDTTVSIAANIPGGVTSIRNFRIGVANPQTGVSVSVVTAPTQANGWNATLRVSRTNWASQPSNAWITMWWDMDVPSVTASVETLGDCSATSTANCSVGWSCAATAPTTVGGLTVTTAMASQFAPLYPGASSTCANGTLDRTCSGTATTDTTVNIADALNGATSISNFQVAVNNPQTGITVSTIQTPSAANGWNAILRVSRTSWASVPASPNVTLSWNGSFSTISMSVQDSGNCSAPATANCGVAWSCPTTAPATVNGVTVTAALAGQVAPLYPGASSSCVVANLNRTCSGTATTDTAFSIADQIAAGVTSIANFTATVQNVQSGVTVSVITPPTLANGWNGVLRTSRTNWASQPAAPSVLLTWNMAVPTVDSTVEETGNVNATGTTNCPVSWRCDVTAPNTVSGLTVTTAMANSKAPLYPGAANTCSDATFNRICSGTATVQSTISIASKIPAGTTSISGFNWTHTNPATGVSVGLVTAPSLANNWVATFSVSRTEWASQPPAPNISMTWNASVPGTTMEVRDTGNCSTPATANCSDAWSCPTVAPATVNGISVTAALAGQVAPLYPGASSSCVVANLNRTCSGTATTDTAFSIADQIAAGVTSISNFTATVQNPQTGVTVTVLTPPTLANGWNGVLRTSRTNWASQPAQPSVLLTWNMSVPTVDSTVEETGNVNATGTTNCPIAWRCDVTAPNTVSGLTVTTAMANSKAPLYPGAANTCSDATLNRTCSGTATVQSTISIASKIPAGTTSISGFNWTHTNPATGVSVSLVSPPSLANNWVATFSVSRTEWASQPPAPNISMTWNATVPTTNMEVRDTGSCASSGSTNCPASWSCTSSAPTTVNGISVTSTLSAQVAPLYPGAANTCVIAELRTSCSGTANTSSQISIADQIPAGVTSISSVNFTVTNPQTGVTVTMTTPPSQANGWVATFSVSRTDFSVVKNPPNVTITWQMTVPTVEATVETTGNTSAASTTNCPVAWRCDVNAPNTVSGLQVTTAMANTFAPLYSGAANTCSDATLNRTCSGTATNDTNVSIAADLPAGTTAITGFNFTVTNPQAGVTVTKIQDPSAANSWTAVFRVVRSAWATVPARPSINLTWNASVPGTNVTVQESGNCSDTGSPSCPASWSCNTSAPTTINGISVTSTMTASVAPLYTGAASTCAIAHLRRVCSGGSGMTATTDVSIASQLPAGTLSISGFTWTVQNPQTGVEVTLLQTPSAANNWVARFSAARTSNFGTAPSQPQVRLSWTSTVPTVTWEVRTSGNVNGTGTQACPAQWACTVTAPATVNGVSVTAAMAQAQPLLYPSASNTCLAAELRQVCGGSSAVETQVSIASQLPAGTTSISGLTVTVNNPQTGVLVEKIGDPTLANNWVVTLRTTRSNWSTVPVQPNVTLNWTATYRAVEFSISESGDCAATGTATCPVSWQCTASAPTTLGGVSVTSAMVSGLPALYPGATNTCVTADLMRACSGTGSNTTDVSIADKIPAGTTSISDFAYTVKNPQAGVTVVLVTPPSAGNNWVARFRVDRTEWSSTPAQPDVRLTWAVPTSEIVFSVVESGSCSDPGSTSCPTSWSCAKFAPDTINAIEVTPTMVEALPLLYPNANRSCLTGELRRVCSGSSTLGAQIPVGELIPAGATAIRNFAFTVENPQDGVEVNLVSAPTLANGWVATFDVVRRVWTTVPARPKVKVTFEVDEVSIALSVRESGDCEDPGSQACPTQWSCALNAPATVNGLQITEAMVASEPLLYPGAGQNCLTGELRRVCDGIGTTESQVSIADQLPEGTTEIFNFTWTHTDASEMAMITVTLLEAPTLDNGWVAKFRVSRDYTGVGYEDNMPTVRLQWQVYGDVEYQIGEETTGDCAGGGQDGETCTEAWVCDRYAEPRFRDPLDRWWNLNPRPILDPEPWEPTCLEGRLVRTCEGDGANITVVGIGHLIPEGKTIRNYRWSVSQPIAGVTVTSLQDPTLENGWEAQFKTTRQDWTTAPTGKPEVLLEWQVEGTPENAIEVVETGDCSREGDAFCKAEWVCREYADDTDGTVSVEKGTTRSLNTPEGAGTVQHQVSFSGQVDNPPMQNFAAEITAGQGYTITITEPPSEANGWRATVEVAKIPETSSDFRTINVTFTWTERKPREGAAGDITGDDLQGREPLYEGASPSCIKAEKVFNCSNTNTGEICHVLDDGDPLTTDGTWCESVSEGSNTCTELENNNRCRLNRTECAEGALASDGFCYVENPVYQCARDVEGTDVVIRETTTCTGSMTPICSGASCEIGEETSTEEQSLSKSVAAWVIADTMVSDWKDIRPPSQGGPTPPRDGGEGWDTIKQQ